MLTPCAGRIFRVCEEPNPANRLLASLAVLLQFMAGTLGGVHRRTRARYRRLETPRCSSRPERVGGPGTRARLAQIGVDTLIRRGERAGRDNWPTRYDVPALHTGPWSNHPAYRQTNRFPPDSFGRHLPAEDTLAGWLEAYRVLWKLTSALDRLVRGPTTLRRKTCGRGPAHADVRGDYTATALVMAPGKLCRRADGTRRSLACLLSRAVLCPFTQRAFHAVARRRGKRRT